jgi:hypothetical protein
VSTAPIFVDTLIGTDPGGIYVISGIKYLSSLNGGEYGFNNTSFGILL